MNWLFRKLTGIVVREITRVELKDNEVLWITVDSGASNLEKARLLEGLTSILPKKWHSRTFIGSDKIQLQKIVETDAKCEYPTSI